MSVLMLIGMFGLREGKMLIMRVSEAGACGRTLSSAKCLRQSPWMVSR